MKVNRRRRPQRRHAWVVGVITLLFAVLAAIFQGLLLIVGTALLAVGTVILAIAGEPTQKPTGRGRAKPPPDRRPRPRPERKPPPEGSVICNATLPAGRGHCMRLTTPGQNCGIRSHPAPARQTA